jgi:hypothetical protein
MGMKKNIWDVTPDDIVAFPGRGFFRWNRDFRARVPMLGVVKIREMVAISDKREKQKFIRGMDVEVMPR